MEMQNTSFNFLVGGVARSGTSALTQALNLLPGVFCAHEASLGLEFATQENDFVGQVRTKFSAAPPASYRGRNLAVLNAKLAEGQVAHFGDKLPDYALHLDHLALKYPSVRLLCIHRSPKHFAASWDAVAQAEAWHGGRIGLFGIFD
ncbi:sulfotransferase, partial [Falsiroseomonas sp. E2-1-a20]|uniref:sulfotransferase n=1 Tax=Falsiroseomonas sp. E2-1-a20 TaxID=3239300 RepID=UPI003F3E092E